MQSDNIIKLTKKKSQNNKSEKSFLKSFCDKEGKIENITITFTDKLLENISSTFEELKEVIFKIKESNCAISFKGNSLKKLQDKMASMIKENNAERVASFISLLNLVTHPQEAEIVGHPAIEDKKTKKIQSIYLFVMNNYQRNITLSEIAQFSGMEKSSFCIFFKKMSQKSFFTFLTEYRIDASCQMLLKTTKSVSEISFTCGFRDIPYYNRVFKKMKQVTPSEYRNNHQ